MDARRRGLSTLRAARTAAPCSTARGARGGGGLGVAKGALVGAVVACLAFALARAPSARLADVAGALGVTCEDGRSRAALVGGGARRRRRPSDVRGAPTNGASRPTSPLDGGGGGGRRGGPDDVRREPGPAAAAPSGASRGPSAASPSPASSRVKPALKVPARPPVPRGANHPSGAHYAYPPACDGAPQPDLAVVAEERWLATARRTVILVTVRRGFQPTDHNATWLPHALGRVVFVGNCTACGLELAHEALERERWDLWTKTRAMFVAAAAAFPDADFFCKVDTDTYLFPERLFEVRFDAAAHTAGLTPRARAFSLDDRVNRATAAEPLRREGGSLPWRGVVVLRRAVPGERGRAVVTAQD